MPAYRVYFLETDGHVKAPPKTIECVDDYAAIKQAREFLDDRVIEVWKGARLISTLITAKQRKGT